MNKKLPKKYEKLVYLTKDWSTPATLYPLQVVGDVRLKRVLYDGFYNCWGVQGFKFFYATKTPVTVLQEKRKGKWEDWMVDDPPHQWCMERYAKKCSGKVLVAGLGLGLVVHELCKNSNVEQIIVIEINSDVIKMIKPLLPKDKRLKILKQDFFKYIEKTKIKFNSIILDLWVTDNKEEMMDIRFNVALPLMKYLVREHEPNYIIAHGFGTDLPSIARALVDTEKQFKKNPKLLKMVMGKRSD